MESSPSYSPEDRSTNRDRDGKERSYQPSPPPESMFVDPRRQEAPRAPLRTPLEGVINLRPVSEATQGYMQQQAEQAEAKRDKDKKDEKRQDYAAPVLPVEPPAPTEARPAVEQPAETPVFDQREDIEPLATEQESREPEQPAPVYAAELNAAQPEQADEDANQPVNDGIQRAWYYTPPQATAQPGAAEYPVPAAYGQEQAMSPFPEAPVAAPEDWRQHDATPAPEYPAEQPASPQPEAEPAAWHYGADHEQQPPAADQTELPAPQAAWEAPQDTDPAGQTTSSNPLFGARTPQSQYQYAAMTAPSPFGGGPNNPNIPNTPNTPSGPGGPGGPYTPNFGPNYNQQPYAAAGSPSSTLERHLPVERHTHRGLVLGIVGGLLLEHHLAKNRDKKLSERIDKLQKENGQVQEQTYWANQELQHTQQALRTEQQRTQEEIAKLRAAAPETPGYAPPTAETRADVSGAPVYAAAGVAAANMAPNRQAQPEQRPAATPQPEQQPDQDLNQQQEYVDNNGKSIRLRPGEHIRRSEWHTYVEKDGHIVDAIDYGRALHEEQQQELGHAPQFDNGQAGAAQGQMFGTNQGMYGAVNPSLPSGMTAPSLPTGQPTHADPQHQLPEHAKSGKQVASNFANPWFWLMLALIFAAFFITITV